MNKKILILLGVLIISISLYFVFRQVSKKKSSVKPIIPNNNISIPGVSPTPLVPDDVIPPSDVVPGTPGTSPLPLPPAILQSIIPGAPVGVDTALTLNSLLAPYVKDCISQKGVINIDEKFSMNCLKYIDGTALKSFNAPITQTQIPDYLTALYPAFTGWKNSDFTAFYNGLQFRYNPALTRIIPVEAPIFYNLEYIEVLPVDSKYYKALDRFNWKGAWYYMGSGTGWFIKTKTCLFAYNSLHLLNLFGISDGNVTNFGSPDFKTFVGSQSMSTIRQSANSPTAKIPYLNETGKIYITQLAVQRGYRCIQLSNEWDGKKYERYYIDLIEPLFSMQKCIQKNPFSVSTNPNTENLWLDAFFSPGIPRVDSKYIIDTVPPKPLGQRYGDFAFKTGCAKERGVINIADMLLTCLKIINFGAPTVLLHTEEKDIDWKSLPQSTELEKLQSYFTVVYGSPEVWKTKSLATLQDYWNRMEMRYKLPIFPTSPYKQYSKLLSFGTTPGQFIAYQEDGRPGEAVKYIEVMRQNKKEAYYETTDRFNGCYYYACRGSGLFLPVGKMFIGKTKHLTAQTWGTEVPMDGILEDIEIAKLATYKGYDTLLLVRYCGFTCPPSVEVVSLRDPITSLMSLIRTHPWDPRLNEIADYDVTDEYSGASNVNISSCIIKKQYEPGLGNNVCPL